MIVFDLACDAGHRFEGWFSSSVDYERQNDRGLVACPQCGSAEVAKAPMAPRVPRKGSQQTVSAASNTMSNTPLAPQVRSAMARLAKAQAKALEGSTWVGRNFAEETRAMHYGEKDHAAIHGEASLGEAKALLDEGVAVAPLPLPIAPPDKVN